MKLPDWATHVAVDPDGSVWAYPSQPVWSNLLEVWVNQHPSIASYKVDANVLSIANLLCVAIPRPEREENANDG